MVGAIEKKRIIDYDLRQKGNRMKSKKAILMSLLWVLFLYFPVEMLFPGRESRDDLVFELIGSKSEGISGTVFCVYQDSYGFVWFGTLNGLYQYDGYEFTHYTYRPSKPGGLSNRYILSIAEDRERVLWVGTANSLERFERGKKEFTHFQVPLRASAGGMYSPIGAIVDSAVLRGSLWVVTSNGLESFDKARGEFAIDSLYVRYTEQYPRKSVTCITEDAGGFLWFGTAHGLHKYDIRNKKIEVFRHNDAVMGEASPNFITKILPGGQDSHIYWIGTRGGLCRFDSRTKGFTLYRHDESDPGSISHNVISDIALSHQDGSVIWLGTEGGGLVKFNTVTGQAINYKNERGNETSLKSNHVTTVYESPSGVLWLGTLIGGGRRANVSGRIFKDFSLPGNNESDFSEGLVFAIYEARSYPGKIWVSGLDGFYSYEKETGQFDQVKLGVGESRGMGDQIIYDLLESSATPGEIWLGTMKHGLICFDPRTNKMKAYTHEPANPASISENAVYKLYESPGEGGVLWAGTLQGGLNRLEVGPGEFKRYGIPEASGEVPCSILDIIEIPGRSGVLWLATLVRGFVGFDKRSGKFTLYPERQERAGTISESIFSFHYSLVTPGDLWMGGEKGVLKFDLESKVFVDFKGQEGLSDYQVARILEDGRGNFWISTSSGLIRFNPVSGDMRRYDTRDGLMRNEFSRAAWKSETGEMYWGNFYGFNSFDPEKVSDNLYQPPVVITDFLVFNRPVKVGDLGKDGKPILERDIMESDGIRLSYEDKMFAFRFAALNYKITEKNQYAYRMEGFDNKWNEVGETRMAIYTGLPAGHYRFWVKGSNNDGVWNEKGVSIGVVILPPWWQTVWAYIGYGLVVVGLLVGFFWWQRVRLVKKERAQAQLREAELRAKAAEAQARVLEAENQRKVQELEEARKLQLSMLPGKVPVHSEFEIGVYIKTATEVGGDYYDFYTDGEGCLTVAVGDATGHGLKAGTMVSIMKGVFLTEVDRITSELEGFIMKSSRTIRQMKLGNLFMGLTLLRVKGRRGVIASAGMPPVYVYREETGKVEEILHKAPPLGAFEHFSYCHNNLELKQGDTLLMLSDGLPELFNLEGEMFGYGRVKELLAKTGLKSPAGVIEYFVSAGEEWLKGKPQDDDITFVVLKVR